MERIYIAEYLSYWKATEAPLSADVGVIEGASGVWLYDVGNSEKTAAEINALPGRKNIVLSHFHPDHIGNLPKIRYDALYQGANTLRYTGAGTAVTADIYLQDGVQLHLFPLPSSHAKGSLGLEVNETYAFLGDGAYSTRKAGRRVYNAGLLLEQIRVLRGLKARWFLLSHDAEFVRSREEVLSQLEAIYKMRSPKESYIVLSETDDEE